MSIAPFADVAAWLRPRAVRGCALTPQAAAAVAALRRLRGSSGAYQREHTLGYSRMVRNADGVTDWERGSDGAPIFMTNGESAAGRELVNAKLRAERPAVLGYREHVLAQSRRASKPRADGELVAIVRTLAKRTATAKALWPALIAAMDSAGLQPRETAGDDPRRWRIDYTDTDADGRARHVTLEAFRRKLREARSTQ